MDIWWSRMQNGPSQHLLDVNAAWSFEIATAYGRCTAWRAGKEALTRGKEFGTIGGSPAGASANHVPFWFYL